MAKSSPQKAAKNSTPQTSYDDVPYNSYPFAQTSPELIQGIAKIFGLNAPAPATARVLEIGCASGGNIISIAARFPESQCVGFDYSKRQIDDGIKVIEQVGLKNVQLKHLSATDVTKELGEFDYIICHGVISWVPAEVREKIVQICSENLSKDGVAYVSYNTLPGWNSVRSVREMMLYHTAGYQTPAEKAQAARQVLKFVGDAMRANGNPTSAVVDRELELLNSQADSYLLHEHLEDTNHQYYFHEFMSLAGKFNLQYLAETSLEKMFSGNFSKEVAQVLATSADIVRTEQYMDYIYDRRFRSTLLCHKDRILKRNIDPMQVAEGYIYNRYTFPAGFASHVINSGTMCQFSAASGMTMSTDDPLVLALLQSLLEHSGAPVSVPKLVNATTEKLKKIKHPITGESKEIITGSLCEGILRHIFLGGIAFYSSAPNYATEVSAKPCVTDLARFQAENWNWCSGLRMEHFILNPFDKKMIPLVDGKHDKKAICAALEPHFASGELQMSENNQPLTDMQTVKQRIPEFVEASLQRFAELGLLVK